MRSPGLFAAALLLVLLGCRGPSLPRGGDHPRIAAGARMTDITLHSAILGADVPVRFIAPEHPLPGVALSVVYVLHGAGENFRTWTDETPIATLAARNVLLVMPDGLNTYYVNDARGHRYEDFFFQELMPAVHANFPAAATDRAHTALMGNSRGGFAATLYGLKHPDRFAYVAGLSSAMDLADRHFRWRNPRESWGYRQVFGPRGSAVRRENDPYRLVRSMPPASAPFLDLLCGEEDSLLASNVAFASLLEQRGFAHRWQIVPGGHQWSVWNAHLPQVEERLLASLAAGLAAGPAAGAGMLTSPVAPASTGDAAHPLEQIPSK